jgi:alpha-L-fucosidase
VFQKSSHYGAAMAVDGDDATRWATDASVGPCWLEVDMGKPETFDRAVIDECTKFGVRVKAFELQYQDGRQRKTFFQGTAMGPNREVKFPARTAQQVRLNIAEGEKGPTINEFQLFAPAKKKAP